MEHLLHMMLRKVKHLVSVLLRWVIRCTNRTPLPFPDCSHSDPGSKSLSGVTPWQLKMTVLDPITGLSLSSFAPSLVTPLCRGECSSDLALDVLGRKLGQEANLENDVMV